MNNINKTLFLMFIVANANVVAIEQSIPEIKRPDHKYGVSNLYWSVVSSMLAKSMVYGLDNNQGRLSHSNLAICSAAIKGAFLTYGGYNKRCDHASAILDTKKDILKRIALAGVDGAIAFGTSLAANAILGKLGVEGAAKHVACVALESALDGATNKARDAATPSKFDTDGNIYYYPNVKTIIGKDEKGNNKYENGAWMTDTEYDNLISQHDKREQETAGIKMYEKLASFIKKEATK